MKIHASGKVLIEGNGAEAIINAEISRLDLLIDEIINEKGIDYVLNAVGGDDILKYLTSKG
jgi:NADPH:quinone reductase-like Zn-dependent oxidoreductase